MTDFLEEDVPLSLEPEPIPSKQLGFNGEAAVISIPWHRDGRELAASDPDGLGIGLDKDKGIVLMVRGGCPDRVVEILRGGTGWSEKVQAMTPERAMVVATQLIRMAHKCRELREGKTGAED